MQRLVAALPDGIDNVCVVGSGCEECRQQGTTGRTVIAEVILPDAQLFEYLRAGEKIKAHQYWLQELNGRTILDHAVEKVAEGIIDPRMAEKVVGHLVNNNKLAKHLNIVEAARVV
mgnify:CR=1 FL=1